jgi:hypothetical protein
MTASQIEAGHRSAVDDSVLGAVTATPGAIVRGGALLNQSLGNASSIQQLHLGKSVDGIVGNTVKGAKILGATVTEGTAGLYREGGQYLLDEGVSKLAQPLVHAATRAAVAGGMSAAAAGGAAGLVYAGSSVLGGYLRNEPAVGIRLGLQGSIGNAVDNLYFDHSPDILKEWVSGVRQVDVNSAEFEREQIARSRENRMRESFKQMQQDNARLEALSQRASVAARPGNDSTGSNSNYSSASSSLMLPGLLTQLAQSRPPQPVTSPQSPAGTCPIDPKTGCHFGHDEKSHPGGCRRCGSR